MGLPLDCADDIFRTEGASHKPIRATAPPYMGERFLFLMSVGKGWEGKTNLSDQSGSSQLGMAFSKLVPQIPFSGGT